MVGVWNFLLSCLSSKLKLSSALLSLPFTILFSFYTVLWSHFSANSFKYIFSPIALPSFLNSFFIFHLFIKSFYRLTPYHIIFCYILLCFLFHVEYILSVKYLLIFLITPSLKIIFMTKLSFRKRIAIITMELQLKVYFPFIVVDFFDHLMLAIKLKIEWFVDTWDNIEQIQAEIFMGDTWSLGYICPLLRWQVSGSWDCSRNLKTLMISSSSL